MGRAGLTPAKIIFDDRSVRESRRKRGRRILVDPTDPGGEFDGVPPTNWNPWVRLGASVTHINVSC